MKVKKNAGNINRVVVLNSGGFDSVCLMHHVRDMLGNGEHIYSLFFDYGQRNVCQERECSRRVAEKVGAIWKEIKLPKFRWTSSRFYDNNKNGDSPYLEYRNLIFLSYAFSYAESIGAIEIYAGFYRDLNDEYFLDTSPFFVEVLNQIDPAIRVITPFRSGTKFSLAPLVKFYSITEEDVFSCDQPIEGKPCGKCTDCNNIKEIFAKVRGI